MRRTGWVLVLVAALVARWCRWPRTPPRAPLPLRGTNWVLTDRVSLGHAARRCRSTRCSACRRVEDVGVQRLQPRRTRPSGSRMRIGPRRRDDARSPAPRSTPTYEARLVTGRARAASRGTTLTLSTPRRSAPPRVPGLDRQGRAPRWVERHQLLHRDAIQSPSRERAHARVRRRHGSGNSGCNTFDGGYRGAGRRPHRARSVRRHAPGLRRPGA